MDSAADASQLLAELGLSEYEVTVLDGLLSMGPTTAPNLADATDVPKARIYDVLESLADRGFIKVVPGRPKQYHPKAPADILDRAEENARQAFEADRHQLAEMRESFIETFQPRYEMASEDITPTEELFSVVDVGKPSETETRALYRDATETVNVLTKSFEYFEAVEPAVADAIDRDVAVQILFVHPRHLTASNADIQADIIDTITGTYPVIDCRFSEEALPWRGTLADPSMDYDTGRAILLVEEHDIPLEMRQAAVTDNGSFVAGLKRYFDLIWSYESTAVDAVLE